MLKVVIDTNVFISAFYLPESRPANVVLLARRKTILNLISPEILKEVERIIKKKLLWDNSKTEGAVRLIKNFSEEVHPQERLAIIVDDPDNRILECAVAGRLKTTLNAGLFAVSLFVFPQGGADARFILLPLGFKAGQHVRLEPNG
jgi:putative PIN family toxin of toxin-antitoxin system